MEQFARMFEEMDPFENHDLLNGEDEEEEAMEIDQANDFSPMKDQ